MPSPAHVAQSKQSKVSKLQARSRKCKSPNFEVGDPCYALYYGPRRNKDARWVPAVVTKVFGTRSVQVKVYPQGPSWRRHIDQLQPRHVTAEDLEPADIPINAPQENRCSFGDRPTVVPPRRRNPRLPSDNVYGPHNPRRSKRLLEKKSM